jgi:hypothetical protein
MAAACWSNVGKHQTARRHSLKILVFTVATARTSNLLLYEVTDLKFVTYMRETDIYNVQALIKSPLWASLKNLSIEKAIISAE